MRARYPDQEGFVERDEVKIFYEVFGKGDPGVLLLPTWSILHSRLWKAQVPYLARHCRVITFDGRGNGRSSRPASADAYSDGEFAADALAVMDATATRQAVLVSVSLGACWAKFNRHYWHKDFRGFLEFFMSQIFTEPHSTKPIEDALGWGLETTPQVLIATRDAPDPVNK